MGNLAGQQKKRRVTMLNDVPDKKEVLRMVEGFVQAWEAAIVKPTHPLVAVQELRLEQSSGGAMGGVQKRTGRSQPPIRDIGAGHIRTDRILKHVADLRPVYRTALEHFADTGNLEITARQCKVSKRAIVDVIREGIVAFQSGWLLIR